MSAIQEGTSAMIKTRVDTAAENIIIVLSTIVQVVHSCLFSFVLQVPDVHPNYYLLRTRISPSHPGGGGWGPESP